MIKLQIQFIQILIYTSLNDAKIKKQIQFTRDCVHAPREIPKIFQNSSDQFPHGLNNCIPEGIFAQQVLGDYLRTQLIEEMKFTLPDYDPIHTAIYADTDDRAIQSAYSFLDSFYPNQNHFTNPDVNQRLPIISGIKEYLETKPELFKRNVKTRSLIILEKDYLIGKEFENCQYDKTLKKDNLIEQDEIIQQAVDRMHSSGLEGGFDECVEQSYALQSFEYSNQDLSFLTDDKKEAIRHCHNIQTNYVMFNGVKLILNTSPFLESIQQQLFNDERTLFLQFTHGNNIAPLMNQFNFGEQKTVPVPGSVFSIALMEDESVEQIEVRFEDQEPKKFKVDEFKAMLGNPMDQKSLCNKGINNLGIIEENI